MLKKENWSSKPEGWAIVVIYIFLPSTDNNRACSNSSKVGKFDHRRPKKYSQRSTHADLIFWHVSTLCEQRSGLLNSTLCNFYNQHCVWLLSILPATLHVTQEHCKCNQISISFDYFYLITKPTIVFPSRLSSHASTLSPSQYLFTSIHHLTQSSRELTKISSAYQYILLFIRTM